MFNMLHSGSGHWGTKKVCDYNRCCLHNERTIGQAMWPSIFLNSAWIMMKEPSPLYKTMAELSCPVHQLLVLATKKKTRLKIVAVTYIFSRVRKSALLWNTSISKISISKALLFRMVRNLWRGFPEILLASVTDSLLRRSCAPTKAWKSVWLDTGALWVTFHAYILRIAWLKRSL